MTSEKDASIADLADAEKPIDRDSLYAELVDLRRPGLRHVPPKDLAIPGLRRIADVVSPNSSDEDRLKDAMQLAANRLGEGNYSEAIADLWGIGTTVNTKSSIRRKAAIDRLDTTEEAFNRRIQKEMTEALAAELMKLLNEAAEADSSISNADKVGTAQSTQALVRGRLRLLLILGAVLFVSLVAVGIIALHGEEPSSPPLGAAVNAETGAIGSSVRVRAAQGKENAQISGGNIFRACNLATEKPCRYPDEPTPIHADAGDLVNFKLQVDNPSYEQLPYAKFTLHWAFYDPPSPVPPHRFIRFSRLRTEMAIRWPYANEAGIGSPPVNPVIFLVPLGGATTGLSYIPGSTKLLDSESHFLARLPDGIADNGIALTNIGLPPACHTCDGLSYIRFIEFKMFVSKDQQL